MGADDIPEYIGNASRASKLCKILYLMINQNFLSKTSMVLLSDRPHIAIMLQYFLQILSN
jgi:hypothetical protein